MTDLTALAQDPKAFDAELAALYVRKSGIVTGMHRLLNQAHTEAGDRKHWIGRTHQWTMQHPQALDLSETKTRRAYKDAETELGRVFAEIRLMNAAYTGWSRFILCTSPGGHVHNEMGCSSLRYDTPTEWHPELSGLTEAEAVDLLDTGLCSKCYPSAPVAIREGYVSKRSQAEAAQRAAEKVARNAAKALKTLSQDETNAFGELGFMRRSELPTTVAALKALVRQPADTAACLSLYRDETWQARALANGWTRADLDRRIDNQAAELENDYIAAKLAIEILARREADLPGSGQTEQASRKAQLTATKNKLREYMAANR